VSEPASSQRAANHLIGESSPYLLQHAHNPVDWRPWGDEALALAHSEEKPIFLSIGYAACHWCHVMERESFEDERIAAFLNRNFVAIKVDREERPDLDAVYMSAVQALTGGGGWPMSVFLTPEGRPFFGGTYFPPERRHGMPSFPEVLQAVATAWAERRSDLENGAALLAGRLAERSAVGEPGSVDAAATARGAVRKLANRYDLRHGGFGDAPKFPTPSRLSFLLRQARAGDGMAAGLLAGTLDGMAVGGIYDWVGGGFHRYSVDAAWLVPHFEKMLYDNALLGRLYGEAGIALDNERWTAVARETADYLIREMQGPEGGFYSSTDADSEGEEGLFFTWTAAEVRAALVPGDAQLVVDLCRLDSEANFDRGRSVLRPQVTLAELAHTAGESESDLAARVEHCRAALRSARSRRVAPALDDKRLAAWNGMTIWSLAWLGASLEAGDLLAAARRAGAFLLRELVRADGRIERSWRDGRSGGAETLEDLAWVLAGLVELYQADGDTGWLRAALRVADARLARYQDPTGRAFETPADGERLFLRPHSATDGATPASGAVLASALLRLGAIAGRGDLAEAARRIVAAEAETAARQPDGASALLDAAAELAAPITSIVVVGDSAWPSTTALLRAARRAAPPTAVVVPAFVVPVPPETVATVPLLAGRERAPGTATAYLCEGATCRLPTGNADDLAAALRGRRAR
jgi:uncharacterized protein